MPHAASTEPLDIEALIKEALRVHAGASLRESGSLRMLGDLQLQAMDSRGVLVFSGAKRRDQHPTPGTILTLCLLVGEEAYLLRTSMLDTTVSQEDGSILIRVVWPTETLERHLRASLRVASPAFPPLDAEADIGGRPFPCKLLSLTETGVSLAFAKSFPLVLKAHIKLDGLLPGDIPFQASGEIRSMEILEDDPLPLRVGFVLNRMEGPLPERMRRFIQARRNEISTLSRQAQER